MTRTMASVQQENFQEDEVGELIDISEVLGQNSNSSVLKGNILSCFDSSRDHGNLASSTSHKLSRNIKKTREDMWTLTNDSLIKEVQMLRESNKTLQDNGSLLIDQFHSQQSDLLKVREKVSLLFQENCSLQEQLAKQSLENRTVKERLATVTDENTKLKRRLSLISQQLRSFGGSESSLEHRKGTSPVAGTRQWHAGRAVTAVSMNPGDKSWQILSPIGSGAARDNDYSNLLAVKESSSQTDSAAGCWSVARGTRDPKSIPETSVEIGPSLLEAFDILGDEEALKLVGTCCRKANRLKASLKIQNDSLRLLIQKTASLNQISSQEASMQTHLSVSMPNLVPPENEKAAGVDVQGAGTTGQKTSPYRPKVSSFSEGHAAAAQTSRGGVTKGFRNEKKHEAEMDPNTERICPLCEFIFPCTYPQSEFEAHVMGHFESEEFEIIGDSS